MDVLLLTPVAVEYQIVRQLLEQPETQSRSGRTYEVGHFRGKHHHYQLGIRQTGSKNTDVALATIEAILDYQPSILLLVGIAAGVKDVKLGDIVVATRAYGYDTGKETDEGLLMRPEVYHYDADLVEEARTIERNDQWRRHQPSMPATTKVVFGPIASGNKVIASDASQVNDILHKNFNDTTALEMESVGFAKAVSRFRNVKAMNIRGISDLRRNKSQSDRAGHQEKAVTHLLAFLKELIFELDFKKHQLIVMDAKNLSQQLVDYVFPLLKLDAVSDGQSALPPDASPALRQIWEQLSTIFTEEIRDEDDPKDAKVTIRSRLRNNLEKDDALRRMLSALLPQPTAQTTHKTTVKDSKNVVTGNKIQAGGSVHIGDIVTINPQATPPAKTNKALPANIAADMRQKITRNKIKAVLEQLLAESIHRDEDLYQEAVHQSQRWNDLQKDERLNIITYETASTVRSRIVNDTLKIISELEQMS